MTVVVGRALARWLACTSLFWLISVALIDKREGALIIPIDKRFSKDNGLVHETTWTWLSDYNLLVRLNYRECSARIWNTVYCDQL